MKTALILLAALPALGQQNFDFSTLEKLGAHAKESTNISLEGETLKAAASLANLSKDSPVLQGLKAIQVRSYEFDKPGQYNPADLDAVRAYVKSLKWTKIIDVKEESETTEIYLQVAQANQTGGLAIISTEPQEVTVIFISGTINLNDLSKLTGNLGIPDMTVTHGAKKLAPAKKD
jgi:hypothetical protein